MANSIPANITCKDQIFDFDFHPTSSILAAGLITGEIEVWSYTSSKNTRQSRFSTFQQSCRGVSFNKEGNRLFTISSDQSWKIIDVEGGDIVHYHVNAHNEPINKLCVLNDNVFLTGDDDGVVKLWDSRTNSSFSESMTWDAHSDQITDFESAEDGHTVLSTGGDAVLCVYDIRNQQNFYKSDDQESELHSLKIMKNGRRVYCGSQEGPMVIFKWGQWLDCVDRFIDHPDGIECIVKIDEVTMVTGSLDGSIRLVSIQPSHKIEGIIGEIAENSIENMKLQRERSLLANIGTDEIIRFWDVSEILDLDHSDDEEEEESSHPEDSVSESESDGNDDDDDNLDDGNGLDFIADESAEDDSADEEESESSSQASKDKLNSRSESDKDDDDSDDDSDDSDRRPKKRIKSAREKFYADL